MKTKLFLLRQEMVGGLVGQPALCNLINGQQDSSHSLCTLNAVFQSYPHHIGRPGIFTPIGSIML